MKMRYHYVLSMALGLVCLAAGPASPAENAPAAASKRIEELDGRIRYDADKNIVGVDLLGCDATDDDVKLLTCFADLRSLAVSGDEITDAGVKQLAALPRLTELALESTEVSDAGLAVLKRLGQLKSLTLRRSTHVTDAGLANLKELQDLESLSLLFNNGITDAGLAELKGLRRLKLLDLRGCAIERRWPGADTRTGEPACLEAPQFFRH